MEQQVKDRIIEAGAGLIHRKGFNNTGIQEILDAANVPKGSFYHYFKSKEEFGLRIIDYFDQHFSSVADDILDNGEGTPLERLKRLFTFFIEFFSSNQFSLGCPVGNLAEEMGDLSPAFREKLKTSLDRMAERIGAVIAQARDAGALPESIDPMKVSYFIIAAWHGAHIQMKVTKSAAPLEIHRDMVFSTILK